MGSGDEGGSRERWRNGQRQPRCQRQLSLSSGRHFEKRGMTHFFSTRGAVLKKVGMVHLRKVDTDVHLLVGVGHLCKLHLRRVKCKRLEEGGRGQPLVVHGCAPRERGLHENGHHAPPTCEQVRASPLGDCGATRKNNRENNCQLGLSPIRTSHMQGPSRTGADEMPLGEGAGDIRPALSTGDGERRAGPQGMDGPEGVMRDAVREADGPSDELARQLDVAPPSERQLVLEDLAIARSMLARV